MTTRTVLIADDDASIRTVLTQAFARANYAVRATSNATTLWRWATEGQGDVIVTDVMLPDENIFDILPKIKRVRPALPIIVMSARNTIVTALSAAQHGAYDYVAKPFDLNTLLRTVAGAIEGGGGPAPRVQAVSAAEDLPLIGSSPAMQELYRVIARVTQTELTVLIGGESGTGKELVARTIHDFGPRKRGSFVAINMAAIPRELIESELFGHERGAFTGATTRSSGRFEQAQGGTLFLDEIGDMPAEAQTRLLRVLQEGEYTSVGGRTSHRTDARIIAATHRDLRNLIAGGLFREDLYYRLNVVPIRVPPLRERLADIGDLARFFLVRAAELGLPRKTLSPAAIERLTSHLWPGNVRELENLMRRLAAIEVEEEIGADVVARELAASRPAGASPDLGAGGPMATIEDLIGFLVDDHLRRGSTSSIGLYEEVLAEFERPLLRKVLAAAANNQVRAADILGINRNTLRGKLRSRGLTPNR